MLECSCGKSFKNETGLKCHLLKCKGSGTPSQLTRMAKMIICPQCGQHIKTNYKKHFEFCNGLGKRCNRLKTSNSSIPWNKGLTKETDPRISKMAAKQKQRFLNGELLPPTRVDTEEMRKELSNKMKLRYASGWECKAGRCKKYDYTSPIAGKVKLDGSWEVIVATYLDSQGVVWQRNKKRFSYIRMDGKKCTYQPDFWVETWGTFIEVKGYETELDRCKWSQFTEPLLIWKKKEIFELKTKVEWVSG